MWYDINKTLSYNCLLNFVVGPRGNGKTYGCKKKAINNYLRKGEQFVYLRRYDTEFKGKIEKFFDDICDEFDCEFSVKNGKFYIDGNVAGYYIALSQASQYKSVPFPLVTFIIFDEFIIDQGMIRYLPNEVVSFNEMYSTIARLRDVVVMFISNAITFTNPYFLFFDLKLQKGQTILRKGDILLELIVDTEFSEAAKSTRFGKIIAGTAYGKYAMDAEFLRDTDTFIEKMPGAGKPIFNLALNETMLCVYSVDGYTGWYVSEKIDKTLNISISLDYLSHNENTAMAKDVVLKSLVEDMKQRFYQGELKFTSMKAKNMLMPYLK